MTGYTKLKSPTAHINSRAESAITRKAKDSNSTTVTHNLRNDTAKSTDFNNDKKILKFKNSNSTKNLRPMSAFVNHTFDNNYNDMA